MMREYGSFREARRIVDDEASDEVGDEAVAGDGDVARKAEGKNRVGGRS